MNERVGKKYLIDFLVENQGFTETDAKEAVNGIIEGIVTALRAGTPVTISNFGTFRPRHLPERLSRNPKTGEVLVAAETTSVHWRTSPTFLSVLSGRTERSSLASKAPKGTL